MADLATKSDDTASQKEGTRIATVSQGGIVQTLGGKVIDTDSGMATANTKWGARSMGNGGLIGA